MVNMVVVLDWWLNLRILEVFSSLNSSVILYLPDSYLKNSYLKNTVLIYYQVSVLYFSFFLLDQDFRLVMVGSVSDAATV